MNKLSVRPLAQKDLKEIMIYYEDVNHLLAKKFLQETDECILRIQQYPEAFQKRIEDVHIVYLKTFPIGIFYKIYSTEIRIIAALHTSRNPEIWKKRNR